MRRRGKLSVPMSCNNISRKRGCERHAGLRKSRRQREWPNYSVLVPARLARAVMDLETIPVSARHAMAGKGLLQSLLLMAVTVDDSVCSKQ